MKTIRERREKGKPVYKPLSQDKEEKRIFEAVHT